MTMDQQPIGAEMPLEPPSASVARAYLDELVAVERRRDEHIDRRAVGWLSIINAVVLAVFLYLSVVGLRNGATTVTQPVLFAFLIWGQVTAGVATRSGVRWQLVRRRWLMIVGTTAFGVVIVVSMLAAVFGADEFDDVIVYVSPLLAFVVLTSVGVVQLRRAREHVAARTRPRAPLSPGVRAATIGLGVILAGLTALMAAPESVLTSVLLLLLVLVLVAWMFAGASGLGIPALGEQWRWPQFTAYGVSVAAVFANAAWVLFIGREIPFAAISGVAVMLAFVLAASVGGRDAG